jgi:hypothetical protein
MKSLILLIFTSGLVHAMAPASLPLKSLMTCTMEGGPGDWNWSLPEFFRFVSRSPLMNQAGDTVIDWEYGPEKGEIMVIIQRAANGRALLVCGLP